MNKDMTDQQGGIPLFIFSNALKKSLKTMAELDILETKITLEDKLINADQITGSLLMTGEINVMIQLSVSMSMANTIVSFITRTPRSELTSEELADGISELVNMIAGEVRTYMANRGVHFRTFAPFAVIGRQFDFIFKNRIHTITKQFKAINDDLLMNIYFLS
jgi:CheY-specific phosphatase CheX